MREIIAKKPYVSENELAEKCRKPIEPRKQTIEPKAIKGAGVYLLESFSSNESFSYDEFRKLAETEEHETPPYRTMKELDDLYWNSVRGGEHSPYYGDDIRTTLLDEKLNVWNIDKLPILTGSLAKDEKLDDFSEIFNSFVYLGTWRSSFPMHTEDLDSYSINVHTSAHRKFGFSLRVVTSVN